MRLTDKPKTLGEMRPEVAWPAQLQAVMDKALARDANDRYQSAAQFGREFADALHAMPAVAATEGATMVIGAQSAPPAAAGPTKPMPATRVSRADAVQTPPKGRPATPSVPEKKSSIVPIAAGGGVVAVAAVVAWMMLSKPEPTPSDPNPGTALAQAPDTGTRAAAETTLTNRQMDPGQQAPRTDPAPPPRQPSGGSAVPPAPTGSPTPSGPSVATRLTEWLTELRDESVTRQRARSVLLELDDVRQGLTGNQLSEWHFVEMHAYFVLGDPAACRAARDVKRLTTDPTRTSVADAALTQEACQQ